MKIIFAPDSFKESLSAKTVADAMIEGWRRVFPEDLCVAVPMADGGEGTLESLVDATGGTLHVVSVEGPLGNPVEARYGILGDGSTAVIEMAEASGLSLLAPTERNPMRADTYGTGQLICAALDSGARSIIVGLGGSATNDGGAGAMTALGAKFLDVRGQILPRGGAALRNLARIVRDQWDERLKDTQFIVACDVNNPLTGANGASRIFGPQKGATSEMVEELDQALDRYAKIIEKEIGIQVDAIPGAGAAGGLGAGLLAFLSAEFVPGIDLVISHTGLEEKIKDADVVFTGEGSIDAQTRLGKTPYGVARLAKKYGIPVIALAGRVQEDSRALYSYGIDAIFSIMQQPGLLQEAIEKGEENIIFTMENIARLFSLETKNDA